MDELATAVHPALRALLDQAGDAPIVDIDAARAARRGAAVRRGGPAAPVPSVVDVVEPPVRLRMYEPHERVAAAPLVVVHGGGWVWGGLDEIDPLARALAIATGRLTASVGYRLAPEHPFPAALDDVTAAIAWLREHTAQGAAGGSIALLGLSAGGNLAAAVSARLREAVSAQVLVYPMLDPSLSSESAHRYAQAAPLSRARAAWFWDQYAPGPTRTDPAAAPARQPDLAGLPPTHVVLAEVDVLRDEGLAYAEQLRSAAVPVSTRVWPGTVHGFLAMAGLVPETCAAAVADIANWLAEPARSGTATP
jgi:acetyl esterase